MGECELRPPTWPPTGTAFGIPFSSISESNAGEAILFVCSILDNYIVYSIYGILDDERVQLVLPFFRYPPLNINSRFQECHYVRVSR